MRRCTSCGAQHQSIKLTSEELSDWYAEKYHSGVYTHSYEHDFAVGKKRVAAYGDRLQELVLDVGCGNGGFVDACCAADVAAVGQDLGGDAAIWKCPLAEVSGSFGTVTMHDVLEHVVDPLAMLKEVRRLLQPEGWFMLDFPEFHVSSGRHHWKEIEHLWMLTPPQLRHLVERAGFEVRETRRPIPGKLLVLAQ